MAVVECDVDVKRLKAKVLSGGKISKNEALELVDSELEELCGAADEIRERFCGNVFDFCSIINGKSGGCTENCKFCSQSAHHNTGIAKYSLIGESEASEGARYNFDRGVGRFAIVTAGRAMNDAEVDELCKNYESIGRTCGVFKCASHGLLRTEQLERLKQAGVRRYHSNLETSRSFFPNVCTTHSYDDKITTIKNAGSVGLEVCSGGIFGIGETMEDRIDMALDLRELGVKSVPVNILSPIPGTPLENNPILSGGEVRRIVAIYRFILPDAMIRMAGGRGLLDDKGESVFRSGSNAATTGDLLTTTGTGIDFDMALVKRLGYEAKFH
ncbi:MAG: biotin synthase BioB [Synergistaceae bacterium]|jgi:biotin synthase|nr:biotin synthase BioB [Synergistaceae bacterium]